MSAPSALARQTLRDARTRTISFALLFLLGSAVQGSAYRTAYPTLQDRLQLERSFGENRAVRLLYGVPHDLLTVGGYMSWRLGAFAIFAGLWGMLAAVRALRAEEDAGRRELVLSGPVSRADVLGSAGSGSRSARRSCGWRCWSGSSPAVPGSGPRSSSPSRWSRRCRSSSAWARSPARSRRRGAWRRESPARCSPLRCSCGWSRTPPRPAGCGGRRRWLGRGAAPVHRCGDRWCWSCPRSPTLGLLLVAARIERRRDIGQGLLAAHDSSPPRLYLLSSPTALALRTQWGGLLGWLVGIGVFSLIMGVISDSVVSGLSQSVQDLLKKLGTAATTPSGYLGFAFQYLLLALCLFACFQLTAMREEETEQRLETLFALPVRRARWFAGRLLLVAAAAAALALAAGVLAWAGAASQGAGVSLARMIEAGANCLPVTVLFLGLGALALALAPRAGTTIAYALVGAAFLWETLGGLLEAPAWALDVSPFHHVGLVPAESFQAGGAAAMLAVGALAGLAGARCFERRDLAGA